MSKALRTLILLIGCVIGAMVPLGESSVEAQLPTTCIEGSYAVIRRGASEIMVGFSGKTLVLQGQIGANITLNTSQRWAYGFTVFQGNINSTGSMTVVKETIVLEGDSAVPINPTWGQTIIVIEAHCEHPYTAIEDRTVMQGSTTGLKLNWRTGCSIPVGIRLGSNTMPSIILGPFNENNVAGILAVVPESFQGNITLSIPGNTTAASVPFSIYTGQWETQYYYGENEDKIEGSITLDYSSFQNLGAYLSPHDWFRMGFTALDQVDTRNYASQTTPVTHIMRMGNSSSPELLPHNSFNATFSCV